MNIFVIPIEGMGCMDRGGCHHNQDEFVEVILRNGRSFKAGDRLVLLHAETMG